MHKSNYDETAYAKHVINRVRELLNKSESEAIMSGDIRNSVDKIYHRASGNPTEPNIIYQKHFKVTLGNSFGKEDGYNSKTLVDFLNSPLNKINKIDNWTWKTALIAAIFKLPTEEEFWQGPTANNFTENEANKYFTSWVEDSRPTYQWEQCLLWLIDILHRPSVTKVTICLDDLHLIFKIMPTLLHFYKVQKKKIHLIFAPQHAYALMTSREFISLWALGVPITVLDFKQSLDDRYEKGFIFNWLPSDKVIDSDTLYNNRVELIRISTNSFDRYPIAKILDRTAKTEIFDAITRINKKINTPYAKPVENKSPQSDLKLIEGPQYESWFKDRFDSSTTSLYQNCSFNLKQLTISEIWYRHPQFARYRVYQAYKILESYPDITNLSDSHLFYPFNLFYNGQSSLFPTNPPIVEWNSNRWELVEGHHRILALSMFNTEVKIPVLQVSNINKDAFKIIGSNEDQIQSNWDLARQRIVDYHREDVLIYDKRHIETISHTLDSSIYKMLGEQLKEILSEDELVNFSHGKYQVDRQL